MENTPKNELQQQITYFFPVKFRLPLIFWTSDMWTGAAMHHGNMELSRQPEPDGIKRNYRLIHYYIIPEHLRKTQNSNNCQ